jgi:hypothetical protein
MGGLGVFAHYRNGAVVSEVVSGKRNSPQKLVISNLGGY